MCFDKRICKKVSEKSLRIRYHINKVLFIVLCKFMTMKICLAILGLYVTHISLLSLTYK